MSLLHIFVLAVIQGITEFLPISSSAHLNLAHLLSPLPDQGALIDVAIHVGSLFAVIIYFWRDMLYLLRGVADLARLRWSDEARLGVYLVLASVPVFIIGFFLLQSGAIALMRTLAVIAVANLVFALLLYMADRRPARRDMEAMTLERAMLIGLAQAVSLVPGVSRSGVTMTMARFLGFERTEAARFSMLLAIPTILGAGAGASLEIYQAGDIDLLGGALLAAALSFITALLAIWGMMAWLKHMSFTPFVVYRVLLSLALLTVLALS